MIARDQGPRENAERSSQTQMPESLKVPEELAAIQQALDDFPGGWHTVFDEVREREPGVAEIGALWEESDELAEVITVDTGNYYDNAGAMPMAKFIAACKPATLKAVLAHISALQSALKDRDAEIERLKKDAERLEFMCSKAPLRFIEGNDDMWRVYQDEAPPEACAHKWRAIVAMYHPTAREAIDAAIDSMKGDANG